ncbi:MAG TPA: hypothetical protein VN203_06725 [Candidatus Acidoferrum sp.]|nr:hypothetical protein [Candidatus Acidoferrum sp.]
MSLHEQIVGFFKVLGFLVVIGGGLGLAFYLLLSHHKRIRSMERTLEGIQEGLSRLVGGRGEAPPHPHPNRSAAEPPAENSSIPKRMEKLESQSENLSAELQKVSRRLRDFEDRSRALQGTIPLLAALFDSLREIGGKIADLRKASVYPPREEEPGEGSRWAEAEKRKKISENDLVKWWRESGNQLLGKCRRSIEGEFRDAVVEVIGATEHDKEDWRLLAVRNSGQDFSYVLPRKYSIWSPLFQKWFDLEESGHQDPRIGSIFVPLPRARKDDRLGWGLVDKKGRVSSKEEL